MDPAIEATARTLADRAILLLGIGIAAVGLAVALIVVADRFARRRRADVNAVVNRVYLRLTGLPVLGPALGGARRLVPSGYVALHLALGLIATTAIVAFIALAEAVVAGRQVAAFDKAFSIAILERTSPGWQGFFAAMTEIGSATPLGIASGVVAIALIVRRQYAPAVWWIIAQLGAGALTLTLKAVIQRSRPEFAYANELARGWSFPSGHALRIFVFCGLGAYLVLRYVPSRSIALTIAGFAIALGAVVAFSRVYLGAHFLGDVVAGFLAATVWAAVCVSGSEIGLRRAKRLGLE